MAVASVLAACADPPSSTPGDAIDVFGPYRGVEADNFAASLQGFEDATGIEVTYTGSADFVSDLRQRIESGLDAPDIAVVPQPGLISEAVDRGVAVPLSEATTAAIAEHYGERAADLTMGNEGFTAPYRVSAKSLVWYRPDVFEEYGWAIPTTLDELGALVDEIERTETGSATPIAPWCFSMAAGTATGWAATDWVEDLVIRQAGIDAYDRWTAGELAWSDLAIRDALTTFDGLVVASGRAAGGLRSILQVDVTLAGEPMFRTPAECAMYKQASFATSWFPDGIDVGEDVDFFVLPAVEDAVVAPMLVGADGLVQFSDDDDVHRLMEYLVTPDGAREWARRGGYLSARTSVDVETYYTETDQLFAALLLDGRELRFDASDAMPPEIGSGLLWREITSWTAGTTSLDDFVTTIDDAVETATTP